MPPKNAYDWIERKTRAYSHEVAYWIKEFLSDFPITRVSRRKLSQSKANLIDIANKVHIVQDIDYDGPANLGLERLDRLGRNTLQLQTIVLRQICAKDLYGYARREAQAYAQTHKISLTA